MGRARAEALAVGFMPEVCEAGLASRQIPPALAAFPGGLAY